MTASVSTLEPLVPATHQADSGEMLAPLDADTGAGFNLAEVVRVSFDSLFANKTRSFLTMLGVIIGVASVVALLSLGNGASGVDHRTGAEHRHQPDFRDSRLFERPTGRDDRGAEPDHGRLPGHQQPRAAVERHLAAIYRPGRHRRAFGRQECHDLRHDAGLLRLAGSADYQWIPVRRRPEPRRGAGRRSGRHPGQRPVRQRHGGRPDGARQGSDAPGDRRAGRQGRRGHDLGRRSALRADQLRARAPVRGAHAGWQQLPSGKHHALGAQRRRHQSHSGSDHGPPARAPSSEGRWQRRRLLG